MRRPNNNIECAGSEFVLPELKVVSVVCQMVYKTNGCQMTGWIGTLSAVACRSAKETLLEKSVQNDSCYTKC